MSTPSRPLYTEPASYKAARCGEPSYIWRAGQQRRFQMILAAMEGLEVNRLLDNGCGVGMYVHHLAECAYRVTGLEYDYERAQEAHHLTKTTSNVSILCSAGEDLPFPNDTFDFILSHEVLEHVSDDRKAMEEMVRTLRPSGRLALFVPNRGYPFETHGIFWRRKYYFGNIPLVNYLPRAWRNRLAPHVRVYSATDLRRLLEGLPVRVLKCKIIFGAYDNIIARYPRFGRILRTILQSLENSPLQRFGLSHFWVVEKTAQPPGYTSFAQFPHICLKS